MAQENLLSSDGTVAQAEIGEYRIIKGAGYRYFKSTNAAILAYAAVSGPDPSQVQSATITTATALGTAGGFAGIPQFAVGALEYFWALAGPFYLSDDDATSFLLSMAASATAGNQLYSSAVAGVVSDSSAASAIKLNGITLVANTTGAANAAVVSFEQLKWKP